MHIFVKKINFNDDQFLLPTKLIKSFPLHFKVKCGLYSDRFYRIDRTVERKINFSSKMSL